MSKAKSKTKANYYNIKNRYIVINIDFDFLVIAFHLQETRPAFIFNFVDKIKNS